MNIHPGAHAALRMLDANELDTAEMMAAGDLTSPQKIGHSTLFRLRVTGVGYSYRPKHDEYVYRRPENYLTPRFLQRCNGLPVVWEHPPKAVLTSAEFSKRIVGTVMLPYLADREGAPATDGPPEDVWAIARIFDREAIKDMSEGDLSTSPSVVFRDPSVNFKIETDDGTPILVEGPASLVDHVAICMAGVWDKDDSPSGVPVDVPGLAMADSLLVKVADSIDALGNRVDMIAIYERLARPRVAPPRNSGARNG